MGHAILGKDLVRNVESASIPQFLNESVDDVFCRFHSPGSLSNFQSVDRRSKMSCYGDFSSTAEHTPNPGKPLSTQTAPKDLKKFNRQADFRHGRRLQ